jgi:hypothetical protein
MVLPGVVDPLPLLAASLHAPPNCSGADIVLLHGNTVLTIENPVITNASTIGCNVSGQMRMELLNLDVRGVAITGKVDSFNKFTSTAIARFELPIAGITMVVYSSTFKDGVLLLTDPSLRIPDSWGGLEASMGKTFTVNSQGLMGPEFYLPAIATSKLALQLSGALGVYGSGFVIQATGALMLANMGGAKDCFIKAAVTLSVDAFGNSMMEIATLDDDGLVSLAAHRSQIALPLGQTALAAAPMPLESSYLPLPDSLPDQVWDQLFEAGAPEPEGIADTASVLDLEWMASPDESSRRAYDACLYDSDARDLELSALSCGVPSASDGLFEPAVYRYPVSDQIAPIPDSVGLVVEASWQCSGKGIPVGTTGFQLTRVKGTLTLLHTQQSIALEVTFESQFKVFDQALVSLDGATEFQWSPEFAFGLEGVVKVLSMFEVGGAAIWYNSADGLNLRVWWRPGLPPVEAELAVRAWLTRANACTSWAEDCRDRHPLPPACVTTCLSWDTSTRFHLTGSAMIRVGLKKGQLVSAGSLPYPCHCRMCRKWVVYYPCCKWCTVSLDIPPQDIWLAGAGAQFGEFTGDRWGLKGTVSFLGFTTGFYIDHTGELKWGDVSGYKLVDAQQIMQARDAWQAATLAGGPAAAFAGDDPFGFVGDDRMLVRIGLPLADPHRLETGLQEVITYTAAITQTDTMFSVSADVPVTISLISPDGIEITPTNYAQQPGGYIVEYVQSADTELVSAPDPDPNVSRWRFIPASNVAELSNVDVLLDDTPVFTGVAIDDAQVRHYVDVEPGSYVVHVRPTGVSSPALSAPLEVVTGTDYTVLLIGYETAELLVLADENSAPNPNEGRLRVVNAASDVSSLHLVLGEQAFPSVAYRQASGYQIVPAGAYSVTVASGALDPVLGAILAHDGSPGDQSVSFGDKVAWAGDVNGDGYDDLIVADSGYDSGRGRVYLYLGSAVGLNSEPAWTAEGEAAGDRFGIAIAGVGDVNGDGYADILVGAYGYQAGRGKAYLYLGSPAGLGSEPAWTGEGANAGDRFGGAVAGAGDVDGDGFDDMLVGAHGFPEGEARGLVRVYHGSADGVRALWTLSGAMHSDRVEHAAALLPDGRVLVTGGLNAVALNTAELFDPATGQWTPAQGVMHEARRNHTATALADGRILVVGGFDADVNTLASAELYDLDTGLWITTGSMASGRAYHSATLLPDGQVLVTGGWREVDYLASAELYDPETGEWTVVASMHVPRAYHTASLLADGQVLVTGGANHLGALSSTEWYDPDSDWWEDLEGGALNTARLFHTAALLPDGRILVAGGQGGDGNRLASAEIYFPASQTWYPTGDMRQERRKPAAVALADGRVLVAGGDWEREAELYCPSRGAWEPAGYVNEIRESPTLTRLADGRALLVGGAYGDEGAEIFDPTRFWSATGENEHDQFGAALAAAGDINGDGYADALIAAPGYREFGDDYPRGKVYLYHGAQGRLEPTAAWTVSGHEGSGFGTALAGVGDVDGDGYDDVLIGEYGWWWGPGAAHLYAGSATGFSEAPIWTATGASEGHWFGAAVSGAGDVNRDGYADFLIGAPNAGDTEQGAITLFFGAGAGIGQSGWTETASVSSPRHGHTATVLEDGQVLVTGGFLSAGTSVIYDPMHRQWTMTGSMSAERQYSTATRLSDGRVLVVGGQGGMTSAEIHDPSTGVWTLTGGPQSGRFFHSATLLTDGKVLIVGGEGAGGAYLDSAEVYDPATGAWTVTGAMRGPRSAHTATRLPNGQVLVAGGWPGGAGAELYHPTTGQWSAAGTMSVGRERHTANLLADGRVLVVGGEGAGIMATAELYNPATGQWALTGSLGAARAAHTATTLADGRVLVTGGKDEAWSELASAETYDVASGTWAAASGLDTARWLHTASPLPDGRVLVVGGEREGAALSAAEVYSVAREPWTKSGADQQGASFGESVALGGDANGNGYADLAVGAPGAQGGRVYVYYSGVGLAATPAPVGDGDVQTLLLARIDGSPDALGLLQIRDATFEPAYELITTTLYVVDQAVGGTWTVVVDGDIENANISLSVTAAPNPPIIADLTVDASDLENTFIQYRLLSDHRPVTMQIYANDGPVTNTMSLPLPEGFAGSSEITATEVITLFQGIEVANLVLSSPLAVQNAVISTTVDLSILKTGDYRLWVRVEDGVSPPVQGYVWGVGPQAMAGYPTAWNQVRIAASDYDAGKQMAGAAIISIDHTSTWADAFETVITTRIDPEGLYIEFLPYHHPDVDTYLLEVTEGGVTHVITTGLTVHYPDYDDQPVDAPIHYAHFGGLSPLRTYTVRIAALDLDHDLASWSQAETFMVPRGYFELAALQPSIELPAGHGLVTTTLIVTMTADLFSDVYVALDAHELPPGIALHALSYEPLVGATAATRLQRWESVLAPSRLVPGRGDEAQALSSNGETAVLVHATISVTLGVPAAEYVLPFVANSGQLERRAEVALQVAAPPPTPLPPEEPTVLTPDLPLPSCAMAITVTIPPGAFDVGASVRFLQGSNNIQDLFRWRYAGSHFYLTAVDSLGNPIQPALPLSLVLEFDPACMDGLDTEDLHLRRWTDARDWDRAGLSCAIDPVDNKLTCSLSQLGRLAMFQPLPERSFGVCLPLILREAP